MKKLSRSVFRHRRRRSRRPRSGTRFLVVLLFVAAAAVTWQFARQQPVATFLFLFIAEFQAGSERQDQRNYVGELHEVCLVLRPPYLFVFGYSGRSWKRGRSARDRRTRSGGGAALPGIRLRARPSGDSFRKAVDVRCLPHRRQGVLDPQENFAASRRNPDQRRKNWARTRCGNRVAIAPLGPPAIVDPLESDFDQPLFSNDMVTNEVDPKPETYAAAIPNGSPAAGNTLQPTPTTNGLCRSSFFPVCALGLVAGSSSGCPHPPLAVAPEPGTMLLLSWGLIGVYWKSRKSREAINATLNQVQAESVPDRPPYWQVGILFA